MEHSAINIVPPLTIIPLITQLNLAIFQSMYRRLFIFLFLINGFLLAQDAGTFQQRYMLGQGYLQAGQLEKAKSIYQDLYNRDPNNFQYFEALNNVYLQLKRLPGIFTDYSAKNAENSARC